MYSHVSLHSSTCASASMKPIGSLPGYRSVDWLVHVPLGDVPRPHDLVREHLSWPSNSLTEHGRGRAHVVRERQVVQLVDHPPLHVGVNGAALLDVERVGVLSVDALELRA